MNDRSRPEEQREGGSLWVFDVLVGLALGLIVAGIIVAGQAGTAVRTLRETLGSSGLPRGFSGLLGIAIAVAVIAAVVVAALIVSRLRHHDREDSTQARTR